MRMQQNRKPSRPEQKSEYLVDADESAKSFDPRYLAAKKSIDDSSLNPQVWEMLHNSLPAAREGKNLQILELGSGIGTMLARLVERKVLRGPSAYLATDMDPDQLVEARNYLGQWAKKQGNSWLWAEDGGRLSTPTTDISLTLRQATAEELAASADLLGPFQLLLAHAVLDLVDFAAVLTPLLSRLTANGLAYLSCNFDGETIFLPGFAGEEQFIAEYHHSMEARLVGASHTGGRLRSFAQNLGLEILATGRSDWVIHPREKTYSADETFFLHAMVETVYSQLDSVERSPAELASLTSWANTRHQQIDNGSLSFQARHLDILVRRPKSQF
jgi:SAM-dependent methyltransferase